MFAFSFIAPSVVHHVMLGMTLYKSYAFYQEKSLQSPSFASIIPMLKRDQALWVLAICLTNFSNVVLVVQGDVFAYKLVSIGACLTKTR